MSAGDRMAAEIAEQPDVLARILRDGAGPAGEVAAALRAAAPRFVVLAARGSSDHAALYAKYLVEIRLGLPAGLASPSTMTAYGVRPDLRDVVFIGVSQSGGSPDLVESVARARECGAVTVAVTNAPRSPLARAAGLHLDIMAGDELAIAATKTYTAELLTLFLLVEAWRGGDGSIARNLPDAARALAEPDAVEELAGHFARADKFVVTARGYSYPTAREAALKLMETSYLPAQAFSGADLLHGPLAMLEEGSPVLAIVPPGVGGDAMAPVLERLIAAGTDLGVIGDAATAARGRAGLQLPAGVPEVLVPIVDIIPLQVFAYRLALARGHDPDRPRGLMKVTQTW